MITRTRYSRKWSGSTPNARCERSDDLVRRHRAVPVHEVVEIARRKAGLRRERPIRDAGLVHQPFDRVAERLCAVSPPPRPLRRLLAQFGNGDTSLLAASRGRGRRRRRRSVLFPAVTRIGTPIRSASANFSPGRRSRSSSRTTCPLRESASAACSRVLPPPRAAPTTWTSYGAIAAGQTIPSSSWLCSTTAAMIARRADAVGAHHQRLLDCRPRRGTSLRAARNSGSRA